MAQEVGVRLILFLLALFGLFVLAGIFFGVLFPKAAGETRAGILGSVDKFIGKETVKAGEIVVEKAHLQAVEYLINRIEQMRDSPDAECYLSYQVGEGSDNMNNGFPPLNEKGTSIVLEKQPAGMNVVVKGGADGLQEFSSTLIKDVQPCVIGGGSVPKNFYNQFVKGTFEESFVIGKGEQLNHRSVNAIEIKYDLSGNNENRIAYDHLIQKDDFLDFEDGGIIFKTGENICFFPTVDIGWDPIGICSGGSSIGLDDNCLGVKKKIIHSSEGRLKECSPAPPKLRP